MDIVVFLVNLFKYEVQNITTKLYIYNFYINLINLYDFYYEVFEYFV